MEKWQIIYLIVIGIGFLIGWITSPKIAVFSIWIFVIIIEVIDQWEEIKTY